MKKKMMIVLFTMILALCGCNNKKSQISEIKHTMENEYSISIKSMKEISKSTDYSISNSSIGSLIRGVYEIETLDNEKFLAIIYEACDGFNSCYEFLDNYAYVKSSQIFKTYNNAYMLNSFDEISKYEMLIYLSKDQTLEQLYYEYKDILNKVGDLKFNIYYVPTISIQCNRNTRPQTFYKKNLYDSEQKSDNISLEEFRELYSIVCE